MGELPFKEERSTYFFPQHTLLINTLLKYCRLGVGQGACPLRKEKDQHVHPSLVGLQQVTAGNTLVALSGATRLPSAPEWYSQHTAQGLCGWMFDT